MTRRGSTIKRRVETDCHQTNTIVEGCSPEHSTKANDSSVSKIPNVSPHRRKSPRLKAINTKYEAENAISSTLQETNGDSSPSSNPIEVESISTPDDPMINVNLKDLQQRCKCKKRKAIKSVASSITDLNHVLVKPKEEELDLEEPLILLKSNLSNKSSGSRKQRKHSHLSESILPVEERTARTFVPSFSRGEGSSPVATDRSSIAKEVAGEDESNSITERVDENLEVISDEDPLHVGGPDLTYTVKSEIVETCNTVSSSVVFIDDCNALGGSSTELSQTVCEKESADGQSYYFTNTFLHPCVTSHTEMATCNYSPSTVSQMGDSLLIDPSQSVNEVKSGVIEIDSQSTAFVSAFSDREFIGKFSDPGSSSSELHERINGGELECGDVNSFTTEPLDCLTNEISFELMEMTNYIDLPENGEEPLDCCVNEVSIESMETDNYTNLTESGKDHRGEKIELDSSERSCHKVLPSKSETPRLYVDNSQLLSAITDFSSDVCGRERNFSITLVEVINDNIMNQIDNLSRTDNRESKSESNSLELTMSKEFEKRGDKILAPETPKCNHENNVTAEHSLLSRDMHDLCHASGFSEEGGSLGSVVLKALFGDAQRNANEDHITSHIEKSSVVGIYDPYLPQHSDISFSYPCDLHTTNESSPETESLQSSAVDQMWNGYTEKAANSSEIDAEKALDCHSPRASLACSSAVNGLLNVEDSLSKPAKKIQSSAENKSYTIVDMPICISSEMSDLVEGEGTHKENELKCDQGVKVEHSPKKLLSNRLDLSPSFQEKLRQALRGNELEDMIKTANHEEDEVMLSPERMIKRPKSSRNGSLQPLSKGILKSPDTSDRNCCCIKNSLIHTQAQKAITFSQRQMQDIENISTKLLKGLTSMKNIVMESVGSEDLPSASSNFTPEEIRIAIENVSNLEATTKKWLSMMAKDCNRFCKIMKSTENKGAAPVGVRKQPKKITFADEAGGLLCHVKVFEQLPTSFIVPRTDG